MSSPNSRAKGANGEREFIKELTDELGDVLTSPLKRNLEQTRAGGHDILGLEGWALEIKRYREVKDGDKARFWQQTIEQASRSQMRPALAFREDRRYWRVVVPLSCLHGPMEDSGGHPWECPLQMTAEIGVFAFAAIIREQHSATLLQEPKATS